MRTVWPPIGLLLGAALSSCSPEARSVGASLPQTPPADDGDPRIAAYQSNFYRLAEGGRYLAWYGCIGCHADDAPGRRNLADGQWHRGAGFAQLYRAIADDHGARSYRDRIPVDQLWQLTAYVRDLPQHNPEKRRRLAVDQRGEPQGSAWGGPQ